MSIFTRRQWPDLDGTGTETIETFSGADTASDSDLYIRPEATTHALSSTSTFDNTTLAMIGLTPGTYTYTWAPAPGASDGSLTVNVSGRFPSPRLGR